MYVHICISHNIIPTCEEHLSERQLHHLFHIFINVSSKELLKCEKKGCIPLDSWHNHQKEFLKKNPFPNLVLMITINTAPQLQMTRSGYLPESSKHPFILGHSPEKGHFASTKLIDHLSSSPPPPCASKYLTRQRWFEHW